MKAFKVMTPSGVIADGIWASKAAIPERIPDRSDNYFNPEDTEIVQVIIRREEYDAIRKSSGCKNRVVVSPETVAAPRYPELDAIVDGLAHEVAREINQRCSSVGDYPQCRYKTQYVLEMLIQRLQGKV